MKSSILPNSTSSTSYSYPLLLIHIGEGKSGFGNPLYTNVIVLATSAYSGFILHTPPNFNIHSVGDKLDAVCFTDDYWQPFTDTLTLSNN